MKKYILMVVAVLFLVGSFLVVKYLFSGKKPPKQQVEKNIQLAFIQTVKNISAPIKIPASGSLVASDKIKLYVEVQGILELMKKDFKPGVRYRKGEVLIKLNSKEFYTNLQAQKSSFYNLILSMMPDIKLDFPDAFSKWQKYIEAFDLNKPIAPLPEATSKKEKLFVATKNIFTNYYQIKNLEVRFEKYTLTAPFNGVLTEASVTPGTLVRVGQLIGEFISTSTYEMEIALNISMVSMLKIGDAVVVENMETDTKQWTGKIIRINGKVDKNSQTVNVYIQLTGSDLQEGMYLKAIIGAKKIDNVFEVPRNLLIGDSLLYVVEDEHLKLQKIKTVHLNDKTVIVSGLQNGQQLLWKVIPKAYEGMEVKSDF